MLNQRIQLLGLSFAFLFGVACGDDLIPTDGPVEFCQDKCLLIEVGVECEVQLNVIKIMCGPNKQLATANCDDAKGVPGEVVQHCDAGGGGDEAGTTTTGWNGATWDPKSYISVDPASGEHVIDVDFFDQVTADLAALDADETVLRQTDTGTYFVAYSGELSDALELQLGDEFLSLNGFELHGFGAFADAYTALGSSGAFELAIRRGGEKLVLSYRLQ